MKKPKKPGQKNKKDQPKPTPLTEPEISLINQAVSLPEAAPSKELIALAQLISNMTPSLLQQLLEQINAQSTYYTKDSFLTAFNICPNTSKKWIRKGLPYIHLDSILLFRKSDVDEFFNRFRKIAPILIPLVSGLWQANEGIQVFTWL